MNLLAPGGLLLLLLLPVIVAIHMWRVRHRRYTLSSTLLWTRVLSETPLRRPRQLPTRYLLLLLQLSALTLGGVALARPAWTPPGTHRHLLVAVDSSLAMGATDVRGGRLAEVKGQIGKLINGLAPGDTMTLVDAGPTPHVLAASGDHTALRRALNGIFAGYGPSSLAADGPLLDGLRAAGGSGTETYLFAPLGVSTAALADLRRAVFGLHVRLIGRDDADRGVAGLTISCPTGHPHADCEAYARLINTGPRAVTTSVVAVADGAATRPLDYRLSARSATPILLRVAPSVRALELRLDGHDALPADDTAWAVMPLPVHRSVLLVADDPSTPLAQALHAIPNLSVRTVTQDAYSDDMTRKVDLTVVDNPRSGLEMIPGNLLLVNPDPSDNTPLFTRHGTVNNPGVTGTERDDPLLSDVDLSSLVIASSTKAQLPAWARADLSSDAGPLLFSGVTGGRRVAVMLFDPRSSAIDNASNLSSLLAFPTLLNNAVQALAPGPATVATAGETAGQTLTRQGAVVLRPSAGRAVPLISSGDVAALPALRPGLYSTTGSAGGQATRLAVDAAVPGDPLGSSADAASAPAKAPLPPGNGPATLPAPSLIAPWELWAILAVLALFALSGEWWYYVRRT